MAIIGHWHCRRLAKWQNYKGDDKFDKLASTAILFLPIVIEKKSKKSWYYFGKSRHTMFAIFKCT
jgi:hypothetical protein